MKAVVVVGNPKPGSRTRDAGERLVHAFGAETQTLEICDLGPDLLSWGSAKVSDAVKTVQDADLVVVASPTFKGTYSGLLKLFLDQFAGGTGMKDVVAVPLMLGGSLAHALAPELTLRPVLSEIGASCPAPGLFLVDSTYTEDGALSGWVERWSHQIIAATESRK